MQRHADGQEEHKNDEYCLERHLLGSARLRYRPLKQSSHCHCGSVKDGRRVDDDETNESLRLEPLQSASRLLNSRLAYSENSL